MGGGREVRVLGSGIESGKGRVGYMTETEVIPIKPCFPANMKKHAIERTPLMKVNAFTHRDQGSMIRKVRSKQTEPHPDNKEPTVSNEVNEGGG